MSSLLKSISEGTNPFFFLSSFNLVSSLFSVFDALLSEEASSADILSLLFTDSGLGFVFLTPAFTCGLPFLGYKLLLQNP